MSQHDEILEEAYGRLRAGDTFARDRSEYTHAEVLAAVLLLVAEAREQLELEAFLWETAMEHAPSRHLRAAA